MIGLLHTLFDWPQGIVVGNLIASFLIWFPHFVYVHFQNKKVHRRLDAIERNQGAVRNQGS